MDQTILQSEFFSHGLRRYEAIKSHDKATELDPNNAYAWYNRACSNVRKGGIEKAFSDLEKAIEIDGDKYIGYAKEDEGFDDIRNYKHLKLIKNTGNA